LSIFLPGHLESEMKILLLVVYGFKIPKETAEIGQTCAWM